MRFVLLLLLLSGLANCVEITADKEFTLNKTEWPWTARVYCVTINSHKYIVLAGYRENAITHDFSCQCLQPKPPPDTVSIVVREKPITTKQDSIRMEKERIARYQRSLEYMKKHKEEQK